MRKKKSINVYHLNRWSLIISIIFMIIGIISWNSIITNSKDSVTCVSSNSTNLKKGDKCNVWLGNVCRKGTIDESGNCQESSAIIPFICLIISIIFVIIFFTG
jgi:hypothetical protein